MIIGIVGSEAAKFTPATQAQARALIRKLIQKADRVVSGACHLGGIDQWASEEALRYRIPFTAYPPDDLSWEFYKKRNIQIAKASDKVVCITVDSLPATYKGMRFKLCYHCDTNDHVKSGGCWTVKYAKQILGKTGEVLVIRSK